MRKGQEWKPEQYDVKLGFVSELGKGVIEWLTPAAGERILDLGCGTGDLTMELARSGAVVTGMDASSAMIERARAKAPDIRYIVGDGQMFESDEQYDAVFSNAALHWMKQAESAAGCILRALRPGGRFVAEFGGNGNCGAIITAIGQTLDDMFGYDASGRNPWYYPRTGEYAALLEKQGFIVRKAVWFERPTALPDGVNGLAVWLDQFAGSFFEGMSSEERKAAYDRIAELTEASLFREGIWYADYRRLRIDAFKPA